ncbi:hypothetical protein H5410_014424 [Solanum commersonii]|uniref:Gag-pol polyprotein n=1 Tax=Solanum commersonii TaxID=4109 RepID=A0A9J5ZQZ6_SOLCO|nr:hypothetical protein H5410_014424 [Solanum commersonii]
MAMGAIDPNLLQWLRQTAAPRGATSEIDGGANHLYAIINRQEQENSPDVVTSASLSFMTLYIAMRFDIIPEQLLKPFSVSTPSSESILAERVYRNCTISVNHNGTMADLVELDMVEFDVILCMDWLHACYASVDCRTRARKLVFKGCIYHLVRVNDSSVETPHIQSVPVMSEFREVFPDDLLTIPPEREIDFSIDILLNTRHISIPHIEWLQLS